MESKSWTNVDKSGWPNRGAWDSEPDKMQWQDEATGFPCLIVRGPSGALCGYVGVPPDHPYYEVDDTKIRVSCHGGLTYSDKCSPGRDEGHGICHVPGPGEPDHVWWLGFDCAHLGDLSPKDRSRTLGNETYKDLAYVRREVQSLAKQLAERK